MNMFSSPPLRASVGGVASGALIRAPATSHADTAPNGEPIVVYKSRGVDDGGIYSIGAYGMDAGGQWWMKTAFSEIPIRVTPTDGDVLDVINKVVHDYVIPALLVVVGSSVGGAAGFAAALALKTWGELAKGSSIQDSFSSALRQTPGIIDHSVIKNTYESILKEGLSLDQINKIRASLPKDDDTIKAFSTGVALAKAQQTQQLVKNDIEAKLPPKYIPGFREAVASGGLIKDYMGALFGSAGTTQLESMTGAAALKVASAARSTKSGSAGGGGSSTGPGVGTLAVAGVGGFFAWKWWKSRHR